jgi:hypothetical protein
VNTTVNVWKRMRSDLTRDPAQILFVHSQRNVERCSLDVHINTPMWPELPSNPKQTKQEATFIQMVSVLTIDSLHTNKL